MPAVRLIRNNGEILDYDWPVTVTSVRMSLPEAAVDRRGTRRLTGIHLEFVRQEELSGPQRAVYFEELKS